MTRGRPSTPKLSQTAIVDAALELAQENLEPTLGKVARKLGVHVTSLYNHVRDRDSLINAARDTILERRASNPQSVGWEQRFRELALGTHAMFVDYPGLIVPFATTPLDTSKIGSRLETLTAQIAAAVSAAGVADAEAADRAAAGVRALNALIIGAALDSLDPATTPAQTAAALDLGVESLIRSLTAR